MDWCMNDVMPGSDGLRIRDFEKQSFGDKMPNWEPAADRGLWALSDPRLSKMSQDEKEVLLGQYSSLSPSPAHLSHTTNINSFENKVWEIYFYKEVCSFVHWSSSLLLTMFPHIFVLWDYTTSAAISYLRKMMPSESMYCYCQAIEHMEVWSLIK